ncbi:MAG TPA: Cof-type HAD-IIB family hydrolase [Candidatus Dorea intestinigallinarum]|nr:Cof-type HAD-IIB family hydrolase [Candidatus Dorea intestinigallinarum]
MDYQVLVLDLDGTLTNSKKEITPETREALIDIQEMGKKVVLASGRPTKGVLPLAKQLHLSDYGSYILSFNGARITDCRSGQIMYNRYLPQDAPAPAFRLASSFAGEGADILTYTENHIISGIQPNRYTLLESRINHMPILESSDFTADIPRQINKLLATGEPEVISRMKDVMTTHFRSYLNIYCSDPFFLEIMPRGVDKAHALVKLLGSIGFSTRQMICCGDGYNDITMIETAGLGVAMANAQPPVRDSADYITKSNDENGVLHVINKFMR